MSGEGSLFEDEDRRGATGQRGDSVELKEEARGEEELVLPHWREPATGEIPKIISGLSGEHPSWMEPSPARDAQEPATTPSPTREARERPSPSRTSRSFAGSSPIPEAAWQDAREPSSSRSHIVKEAKAPVKISSFLGSRKSVDPQRRAKSTRHKAGIGKASESSKEAVASMPPGPRTPEAEIAKVRGRSRSQSIVTGLALGAVILIGFSFGRLAAESIVVLAVVIASAEYYSSVRRYGTKPATLVGLIAVIVAVVGAYSRGFAGISYGLTLGLVVTMLWYLLGLIKSRPLEGVAVTMFGVLWIGVLGSFASLILRPADFGGNGVKLLLAILITTSAADVFAYFGGQFFGRRKLAPSVSPYKTYEGLISGGLAAILFGAILCGHIAPLNLFSGLLLGLAAAVMTPLGDLCESMIKRSLEVKDTSRLLPGHGGLLDRIDGLLFMLPVAYFLFRLMHIA